MDFQVEALTDAAVNEMDGGTELKDEIEEVGSVEEKKDYQQGCRKRSPLRT